MPLLEREALLAALREAPAGHVVFVAGEAGIGKSALVRGFCDGLPAATAVHFGFCDALGTPRALGPVHDIARTGPSELRRLLTSGADRHELFTAFLDLLAAGPSVVVVEDAHWADAATLDLLLFVGRRIAGLPSTVVVTYRSEEVGREHPLRRVLGDLATSRSVLRLTVPALSQAAVAALAGPDGRDAAELFSVTGGNPFFVTEALSGPARHLPATVRDAVLVRAARLGVAARAILDTVSLVPDRAETALLDTEPAAIDECVRAGMLVIDGPTVRFRHELARRAVEADVPPVRAMRAHGRILERLAAMSTVDPARLSHHAEAAGDTAAVLRLAPEAGRVAAGVGAHREAAAQYARALRHAAEAPVEQQAGLWQRRAEECDRSGDLAAALDASARAIELWRAAGDVEREASVLARRTHTLWNSGRDVEAHASARAAVELLDEVPESPVLAQAYAARAQMMIFSRDRDGAMAMGTAAIAHAERHGDHRVLAWAYNAVGSVQWLTDPDRAVALLTAGLEAARRARDDLVTAGVLVTLGAGAVEIRRYAEAERRLAETVAWCAARDLDPLHAYGLAWLARAHVERGRWSEAVDAATAALDADAQHVPSRVVALTALGRVRVRRGEPDALEPLDRAWDLAEPTGALVWLWPVAAARAEHAWLAGHPERIDELAGETHRLAVRQEHGWAAGELAYWLRVPEPTAARPWALQIGGDEGAAPLWRELGCPYEAALADAESGDPDRRLAALRELQRLGARPAAERLARSLREDGVRRLPRSPRSATLRNPARLTERQAEVLELLAEGASNAEIAARLHISPKTVDHHVSAVLAKLGVGSRQEAGRWARDRQDGESSR